MYVTVILRNQWKIASKFTNLFMDWATIENQHENCVTMGLTLIFLLSNVIYYLTEFPFWIGYN